MSTWMECFKNYVCFTILWTSFSAGLGTSDLATSGLADSVLQFDSVNSLYVTEDVSSPWVRCRLKYSLFLISEVHENEKREMCLKLTEELHLYFCYCSVVDVVCDSFLVCISGQFLEVNPTVWCPIADQIWHELCILWIQAKNFDRWREVGIPFFLDDVDCETFSFSKHISPTDHFCSTLNNPLSQITRQARRAWWCMLFVVLAAFF